MLPDAPPALARFINALALGEGFQFHIAECRTPRQVTELLAQLQEHIPSQSGRPLRIVHLWPYDQHRAGLPANFPGLGDWLQAQLVHLAPAGEPERLILALDATGGTAADLGAWRELFRRLNERRNGLAQSLDGILLLCLPPELYPVFAQEAPDFWSIRGESLWLAKPTATVLAEIALDLSHLPAAVPHFLGRTAELALLDQAWADVGETTILEMIAPGGTGKTSLTNRWLDGLRADNWRGAAKVFGWSFYSQGAGEDRQASDDGFFAAALAFFQVKLAPSAAACDKGVALAQALARQRALLILDGLEPLQYPPTDKALPGELKAPGLKALLQTLARKGSQSLVLVTSREPLADIAGWRRSTECPQGPVQWLDLGNLSHSDGARLLHRLGVRRAGQAAIDEQDDELQAVSQTLNGHALALSLVGSYLSRAKGGDVRRWQEMDFAGADDTSPERHAFHAMAAYETWFAREGEAGARQRAALRLLGFFDRPASGALLAALRADPAIPGLTEALVPLSSDDWNITLSHLQEASLAQFAPVTGSLDAHPLVREYFAHQLQSTQPEAWREGHRRLYQYLKTTTPEFPDTLEGLQPLYQAVAHGCQAGLYEEARAEVYRDRVQRGGEFFSAKKLAVFGADLGALAYFFVEPWRRLAPSLSEVTQAWLLNVVAYCLRALGRLTEALEPMEASGEMNVQRKNWKGAAANYNNLSELQLTLGRVADAGLSAQQAVVYADRSKEWFLRVMTLTTLADAQHQAGETEAAQSNFERAEVLQTQHQPQYPFLSSVQGFQYCDLLLASLERRVWQRVWGECAAFRSGAEGSSALSMGAASPEKLAPVKDLPRTLPSDSSSELGLAEVDANLDSKLRAVRQRSEKMFEWRVPGDSLLDIALDHLTLARSALYGDLLHGPPPGQEAQNQSQAAVSGLRAAGTQHMLPRGLLNRALLYFTLGQTDLARADLDEVEHIASRGGMKLHLADLALTRARLFADRGQLKLARKLIEECGYNRRRPELQDAEAALIPAAEMPAADAAIDPAQ